MLVMKKLYIYIILFTSVYLGSCGAMQKVIKKDKSETKTETETKSVTTATASNTETTAITRTITEEFKDTLTAPSVSASITSGEKKLSNGDTIRGETSDVLIKQYKNTQGKTITEFKTKPKKITVPGQRTIVENVNSVKNASVTSTKKEDTKKLASEKKQSYSKEKEREAAINWTVVVISLGSILLVILLYLGWKFSKSSPKV